MLCSSSPLFDMNDTPEASIQSTIPSTQDRSLATIFEILNLSIREYIQVRVLENLGIILRPVVIVSTRSISPPL